MRRLRWAAGAGLLLCGAVAVAEAVPPPAPSPSLHAQTQCAPTDSRIRISGQRYAAGSPVLITTENTAGLTTRATAEGRIRARLVAPSSISRKRRFSAQIITAEGQDRDGETRSIQAAYVLATAATCRLLRRGL